MFFAPRMMFDGGKMCTVKIALLTQKPPAPCVEFVGKRMLLTTGAVVLVPVGEPYKVIMNGGSEAVAGSVEGQLVGQLVGPAEVPCAAPPLRFVGPLICE